MTGRPASSGRFEDWPTPGRGQRQDDAVAAERAAAEREASAAREAAEAAAEEAAITARVRAAGGGAAGAYGAGPATGAQPYATPRPYTPQPDTQPQRYVQPQPYAPQQPYAQPDTQQQPYAPQQPYDVRDFERPGTGRRPIPSGPTAEPGYDRPVRDVPAYGQLSGRPPAAAMPDPMPSQQRSRRADRPPVGPWPTRVSAPWMFTAIGVIVVVAVVGAIALPRLFNGDDAAAVFDATSLRQPAAVDGLPRLAAAQVKPDDSRSAEQVLTAVRTPLTRQVLVYGKPTGVRVAVVTGRPVSPLAADERDTLTAGFTSGMEAAKAPVTTLDTGSLGGWFGCGTTTMGTTLCLAVDGGAAIAITISQTGAPAVALAEAARAAVEQRNA